MEVFYGVWSPVSGVLPTVTDYDFAAYYITETGALNGTTYTKDKWLVYICEARGKLSQRSYWRISDGLVVFNPDNHTNVPDAGYYTKIRLDNAGNIVAGADIEMDDLPAELSEKLEAITDDNINKLIATQLANVFVNNALNPIQFKYDSKTGKISASLKLDEETIGINEFGQLQALGLVDSENSGTSTSIDMSTYTEALEEIKQRLSDVEEQIVKITPIAGSGINLSVQKGGTIFSVDIDENSLSYNSEGQLCVNPDILTDYINGEGGDCANHQHTASQITDLEEFVKNIINNTSIYNTLVQNIQNLVDEETIIVNSNGQLEAIATNVQKHTHTMNDVTDLNQNIANVWASQQRLHESNSNQDFNNGAVMMSTLTINEVLIAFNQLLKEYKTEIDNIDKKSGSLEPTEPGYIDSATIKCFSDPIDVLDVETLKQVKAYSSIKVGTEDVINYNGGYLYCYIDDELKATISTFDSDELTFGEGIRGPFNITYYGDAYPKIKTFQGYYKGFSFYIDISVDEGTHKVYFLQTDIDGTSKWKSDEITINTYKNLNNCQASINIESQPSYNTYVSGIKATTEDSKIKYTVSVKNFNKKYAPVGTITSSIEGFGEYELSPYSYSGGFLLYGPQEVDLGDFYGQAVISATVKAIQQYEKTVTTKSNFINYDDSTEEDYRFILDGNLEPVDGVIVTAQQYSKQTSLVGDYEKEAQVKDHIAIVASTNYTDTGLGGDYSVKPAQQTITLRFECPKMNNFYFDIVDDEGNAYTVNKNGTLQAIDIYASIAPSTALTRWVDCNTPYTGYGHWDSKNIFNGLDLFKSTAERRYVTFGKDPVDINAGYLYIKLIITKPVNLERLVSSIKESLNERR